MESTTKTITDRFVVGGSAEATWFTLAPNLADLTEGGRTYSVDGKPIRVDLTLIAVEVERLRHELRKAHGRIGGLQRAVKQLERNERKNCE